MTKSQRDAGSKTNRDAWWAGGKVPMLDLAAVDDPFRPKETLNEFKDSFGSRITVKVIPNASHALPDEQPEAVARSISEWIKGLPTHIGDRRAKGDHEALSALHVRGPDRHCLARVRDLDARNL